MRLILVGKHAVASMLVGICAFLVSANSKRAYKNNQDAVELTKVDIFSLPDWKSKSVAIDGFTLGITRKEAFEIANERHLSLTSNVPPKAVGELKAPCTQASCAVGQTDGNWIGVNLFFEMDRITKIKVSVPVDADPEVKKVNIAREFKGLTRQFFNRYSDGLRNRILGPAEGKETRVKVGGENSALANIVYQYPNAGIVIHVTVDKRDNPPNPFDLEVDFQNRQ
jgi:hypothetical protein